MLSVNSQGLRGADERVDVLHYLDNLKAKIVCLQDTHWLDSDIKLIKQLWQGECLINEKKTNARGVAILFKSDLENQILSSYKDTNGNVILTDLALSECKVRLINIYASNSDRPEFFNSLHTLIYESETEHVIIRGDFNLVLDQFLDGNNYKTINNPKSRSILLESLETYNLFDTYRYFHRETRRYTWRRKNPLQQARLDYIFVTNGLLDYIDSEMQNRHDPSTNR